MSGLAGGSAAAPGEGCKPAFWRRLRMTSQNIRKITMPMAAIPPTTPPTMAPTGVELLEEAEVPPAPPPGGVVVCDVVLVAEDEDDEDEPGVVVVPEKLGGVASSVSRPPSSWH
jgi:hypothetical protein